MKIFGLLFLLFFFIIPVFIFLLIILIVIKKTKRDEWKGEIIDKIYETKEEIDRESIIKNKKRTYHFYTIIVKTDKGLIRKVAVSKEMFDNFKIGDRVVKPKGKLNPVRE